MSIFLGVSVLQKYGKENLYLTLLFNTLFMEELQKRIDILLDAHHQIEDKLQKVCTLLHTEIDYYNWVGFYFKNGDKNELKLGPFAGAVTEHTIIPFGKGICGQVAESNELFLVPDVQKENNYLSCSIETKAEIVVPIIKHGENIGQIDIDSHTLNPFTNKDIQLLEHICQRVANLL